MTYEELAARITAEGEPCGGGGRVMLKAHAGNSEIICRECGILRIDLPGWTSDWTHLCHAAMDHVDETGHRVAVSAWHGALYGTREE